MQISNFSFVKPYNKSLAAMLMDAERFLADDSCCFLLKIRLALELWCHDFADLHGIQLALETTLSEKLEILSKAKVFPEGLLKQLTQLRQYTNQAVHIQRDHVGRHITMQPLERAQQISILQCLFDLACYTARFQDMSFVAPLWQTYPKANLRALLIAAMTDDGDACAQVARQQLVHAQSDDFLYWVQRGLKLGSNEALELLTEVAFDKTYSDVDLALLNKWLVQFKKVNPNPNLDELQGRVYERQQQMEKALKSYDLAAKAGYHPAIKRLLDYWGSRCDSKLQEYLNLGIGFNEPHSLLYSMAILIATLSEEQASGDVLNAEHHQTLKQYWIKARSMGIPGVGYIEGMCHNLGLLGFTQDPQLAAQLVKAHFHKLPAYCMAAVNTFMVLFEAEQYADLIKVAPKALGQLSERGSQEEIGKMESDIALALVRLFEAKTPVQFAKTPRQLMQSAARRGYVPAKHVVVACNKQHFNRDPQSNASMKEIPMWAQKLAAKSARSKTVSNMAS